MRKLTILMCHFLVSAALVTGARSQDFPKPYSPPCTERDNVFEFAEKPAVKNLGNDKYEITFAVKGNCDVTVGVIDAKGNVVRHLGTGVLGGNAPLPFQKKSLRQTIYWNGKDDLDVYHKEPGKLRVRVMLGLKPEFDRLLGGTSPKRLPGYVWGIAIGPDGACVFAKGQGTFGHVTARWFDHDGQYVRTIAPPPANLPEEKLGGLGFVEYEPGRRALHAPNAYNTIAESGGFLPGVNGKAVANIQPVMIGPKIYFCSGGGAAWAAKTDFKLHYFYADGSFDLKGMAGTPLWQGGANFANLAVSPDGKWIYMTTSLDAYGGASLPPVVMRASVTGDEAHKAFVGDPKQPGSANDRLNQPRGLDCDAQGRLYVCDGFNSRIQVFAPDGKWLKTIPVDRPMLVRVHQKTGGIYVLHEARVEGRTLGRLTKFGSFDSPTEEWHVDNFIGMVLAVDSWTARPRLWVAGEKASVSSAGTFASGPSVRIFEEDGKQVRKIADFDEEAKKEDGETGLGRWGGSDVGEKLVCDPIRRQIWFGRTRIDLATGKALGVVGNVPGDDIAFDKRGYLHSHFNPGFYQQGVCRFDPDRPSPNGQIKEVPYDYGVEAAKDGWKGILPVKDQPGAKFFQDGIGVNMAGDVVIESNIYYVPKMEDEGRTVGMAGSAAKSNSGEYNEESLQYAAFLRSVQDRQKRGEEVYSMRRQPGVPLAGATIWTYDRNGELRRECAAVIGGLVNGVQIDEDGKLCLVNNRPRIYGETPFLYGRGGVFGVADYKGNNRWPFTGTLMKTAGEGVKMIMTRSPVPAEPLPNRPPDVMDIGFYDVWGKNQWCWVEGAEWMYAGASPIVQAAACSCPTQRLHLDWYKRVFVPEAYRHSIGILDTNGNLIMHVGRYGNFDSGLGTRSKVPIGGDNIAMFLPRFLSGTDDDLVFTDWGERLVVLKLNYHAEETVGIQ